MSRRVYEITIEDAFVPVLRALLAGSSWPITDIDLLKRWLAMGLARDAGKPLNEAVSILEATWRVELK